jgi:hypothetical protein
LKGHKLLLNEIIEEEKKSSEIGVAADSNVCLQIQNTGLKKWKKKKE